MRQRLPVHKRAHQAGWNIDPVVSHANDKAKASNKVVNNNLKRRLTGAKGMWADELTYILWSD